jgi:quinol monooxygenase YgiN
MELVIFARFHTREGMEEDVELGLREQVPKARAESGCLSINAYRSPRNPRLFWIHARWKDEAAFDVHAELANTVRFVAQMDALIDHPFDATRALVIA